MSILIIKIYKITTFSYLETGLLQIVEGDFKIGWLILLIKK